MSEILEQGSRRARPRPRWWMWLIAGLAVAGLVVVGLRGWDPGPGRASGSGTSTRSPRPAASPAGFPVVSQHPGPLLAGAGTSWQLYARASNQVVRLDLASGRVTRTPVPGLASSGPVSFVAGTDGVFIRPLDFVTGYFVPEDGQVRVLTGALADHGPVWVGPRAGTVWLPGGKRGRKVPLVRLDGSRAGASLTLPKPMTWAALYADRAGYLFANTKDGTYDIRPARSRPVPGTPVAAGPKRILTRECQKTDSCRLTVINRTTRAQHTLGEAPQIKILRGGLPFGVTPVSPDGETAPLLVGEASAHRTLHLLDLKTGTDHPTDIRVPSHSSTLAWSPDSRWLFVATAAGDLLAINRHTGNGHRILPGLSDIRQIAFTAQQTAR